MQIFYQQPDAATYPTTPPLPVALCSFQIQRCYFKQLSGTQDAGSVVRALHHHTGFEIHIIETGSETYRAQREEFTVSAGQYLVIPPRVQHQCLCESPDMRKCSFSFSVAPGSVAPLLLPLFETCRLESVSQEMREGMRFIKQEAARAQALSPYLIGARVLEIIIAIARDAGYRDQPDGSAPAADDPRLAMARTYIHEHITQMMTCDEIAVACHVSVRQLTRLFQRFEGLSPTRYIHREKAAYIEKLLAERKLTLREISETMHFSSEYYFNAFLKKHVGMTPGAYRRMLSPGPNIAGEKRGNHV